MGLTVYDILQEGFEKGSFMYVKNSMGELWYINFVRF